MARKGEIREAVKRALWVMRGEGFQLCFLHREGGSARLRCVPSDLIAGADSWAVHLLDGSSIPYHRIYEIRDHSGRPVWKRGEGWIG